MYIENINGKKINYKDAKKDFIKEREYWITEDKEGEFCYTDRSYFLIENGIKKKRLGLMIYGYDTEIFVEDFEDKKCNFYSLTVENMEKIISILKIFFEKGDTSILKENWIIETRELFEYDDGENYYFQPFFKYLEKLKMKKKIDKMDIIDLLKNNLEKQNDGLIIREVIFEKIETYIKENNIENIYFKNREEIKGQENVIKFFKENLVIPY